MNRKFVRYKAAQQITGLALPTLYSKVSRREIPHYRVGPRLVVFDEAELIAWLTRERVAPGQSDGHEGSVQRR